MTHDHDRGEHWSDNPADDFAWNAYATGWDQAETDLRNDRPRRDVRMHSVPFQEGYRDGYFVTV